MRNDNNVIYMMEEQKEGSKFKRKAKVVSEIVGASIAVTLEGKSTAEVAVTFGFVRGLYKWSAKSGLKTGAAVYGVALGINVVGNLARNIKVINDA